MFFGNRRADCPDFVCDARARAPQPDARRHRRRENNQLRPVRAPSACAFTAKHTFRWLQKMWHPPSRPSSSPLHRVANGLPDLLPPRMQLRQLLPRPPLPSSPVGWRSSRRLTRRQSATQSLLPRLLPLASASQWTRSNPSSSEPPRAPQPAPPAQLPAFVV